MHPAISTLNMLTQANVLRENNPFLQEIELYAETFGGYSTDPVCGPTNIHGRYPGLVYLQESMKKQFLEKQLIQFTWENTGLGLEFLHFLDPNLICCLSKMFFIVVFCHLPGLKSQSSLWSRVVSLYNF